MESRYVLPGTSRRVDHCGGSVSLPGVEEEAKYSLQVGEPKSRHRLGKQGKNGGIFKKTVEKHSVIKTVLTAIYFSCIVYNPTSETAFDVYRYIPAIVTWFVVAL